MPTLGLGLGLHRGTIGFRGLLDNFGGAAAAYSLRALSSGWVAGDVVNVRRSSDSTTDDFTAGEVANGTLLAWVDENVVQYTSDFSSTAAGWATFEGVNAANIDSIGGRDDNLRFTASATDTFHTSLRTSFSIGFQYSVTVDVYLPAGNSNLDTIHLANGNAISKDSTALTDQWVTLSATFVADNISLRMQGSDGGDFTFPTGGSDIFYMRNVTVTQLTADGFVTTWYDQSGNGSNATQGTTTMQPQIVDAGSLVVGGLDFDGVDDALDLSISTSQPLTAFAVYKALSNNSFVFGTSTGASTAFVGRRSTGEYIQFAGTAIAGGVHTSTEVLSSSVFNGVSSSGRWNGVEITSGDAGTNSGIDRIGTSSASWLDGTINELIIYDTDQTSNLAAIEANINAFYSIY